MKKPLNDAFDDFYRQQQLSSEQINRLDQLASGVTVSESKPTSKRTFPLIVGTVITLGLLVMVMLYPMYLKQDMVLQIAKEVAKNHIKQKPLEIEGASLATVGQYFQELDFVPTQSSLLAQQSTQLLGGRYCSVQGVTAAQLSYRESDGSRFTLYESAYDRNVFPNFPEVERGERPIRTFHSGLEIQIWVEKGVLMVSANAKAENAKAKNDGVAAEPAATPTAGAKSTPQE